MAEMSQESTDSFTQAKNDEQAVYEVGFHVVPAVGEEGVAQAVEVVRKALGQAEIVSEHFPVKTTLAYTVERAEAGKREKFTESYFGNIKFVTEREAIPGIEAALRAMPNILRFLLIETVREEVVAAPRRAVFASDRLEGQTLQKPAAHTQEKPGQVSEEELDKSIDALVNDAPGA
jgi:ribosomal protein S6